MKEGMKNLKSEGTKEIPPSWFSPSIVGHRDYLAFSPEFIEKFGTKIIQHIMEEDEEEVKKITGFSIQELKRKGKRLEREQRVKEEATQ